MLRTVKGLNVKNGFMLCVKTSVTTITKKTNNDFIVWYSEFCRNLSDISTCGKKKSGRFERYVDDIICTVKRDPNTLLNRANFCKRTIS